MHGRWAAQKCWHLVTRITDIRTSRMPGDRRCQPRPRSERGAGTGSDLTLGPGSDLGCSAPIHLPPREHRNHARTGMMFRRRPRRRAACPSTQAPRQHRCGSLACRRHRYPHSHPTQTWRRSSRRRPPCVAGCRKGKETCCMLMYACPSARDAPLPGAAAAVGTHRCWVVGD